VYAFTGQAAVDPAPGSETPTASATPTETATPEAELTATAVAIEATATSDALLYPTPVMQRGSFRDGAIVRVTTGDGDCLNARWSPGVTAEYTGVNVCLPEGYEGMLTDTAQEAEGWWWWYMAGAGYVAEEYITYVRDADLSSPMAPQFAGQPGQIAFLRDGEIWIMRADGADQRLIVPARIENGYSVWPNDLTFSPDGRLLSYTVSRWSSDGSPPSADLHIIDTLGNQVAVVQGVAGRSWSPDSARIAIVSGAVPGDMGGGWKGVPGYFELTTGAIMNVAVDALPWDLAWQRSAPQFNHDGSKLLITYYYFDDSTQAEQRGMLVTDLAGMSIWQYSPPDGEYVSAPVWSPVADQIAFYRSFGDGGARYEVMDAGFNIVVSTAVPAMAANRPGGCGGGADMNRPEWSADGARLMFGFMYGEAGTNGVWTLDVASGDTSLLPVANTYNAKAGPGTLAVFSDGQHVFIGDTSGGYPALITGGHSPVWSSAQ
jgi:Tol biopolymer transport system component